jgi:histidinol-phosphate phosphatase family protein
MSRLVALDRDGTVIEERPYLSHPRDVRLLPNSAQAIRELRSLGFPVVLVSNQAGIGYGYFSLETLGRIHGRLFRLLAAEGVVVDGVYFCPHKPGDGCGCRKPGVGLLQMATRDFGLQLRDAFVVGDKECDIEMGRRAGATTLLVRTGWGEETAAKTQLRPHFEVDDLLEAAQVIARLGTADIGVKAEEVG